MTQLTEHFSLAEMTYSATAKVKGLDNMPSPVVVARLRNVCLHVLEEGPLSFRPAR